MPVSPLDLTIVLPVRNEEKNLPGCLEAIGPGFAESVVVVDSSSTDQTVEIARAWGAEVLNFTWDGCFPKKRNWYLRHHPPTTRWVLFLDADEFLTDPFKDELRATLPTAETVGFWLSYTIYFLGKPLKGGYPLRKLALFKVGAGEYERIDEEAWSHLDMEIHEHPVLAGEIGIIRSRIDHRDLRGVSHWVEKHNQYGSWEARRYAKIVEDTAIRRQWTLFQKIKYALLASPFIGPAFFIGCFFLMGGFRDGARGFAWAQLKAGYFTQVYCKIREQSRPVDEGE